MSAYSSSLGLCALSPSRASHGAAVRRPPGVRAIVRVVVVLSVGMIILTAAAAASSPETAPDRLAALGRVLRSRPIWSANYSQEYLPAGMTVGETERGTVWVSWPDRAQFRAGDPVVRTMGMEGRRVRLLDLDVPSCDDHRISDDEWVRIPLAAVLDPQSAVDRFTVLDTGNRGFALVPRQPGGVARVEVELGADSLPASVVITDPQGATNSLVFEDWSEAGLPPGGLWLPEPPTAVECVVEPSQEPGL